MKAAFPNGHGSLRARLMWGSTLLVVALSVAFVVLGLVRELRFGQEMLQTRGQELANHLARAGRLGVMSGDVEGLKRVARAALEAPDVWAVRYVDGTRRDLLSLQGDGKPQLEAFQAEVRVVTLSARPEDDDLALFDSAGDGHPPRSVVGWVEVQLDTAELQARVRAALAFGGALMLLFLALGLGGAWLMAKRLAGPVAALTRGAREVADGNLEQRLALQGPSEVVSLAGAFNEMTEALQARTQSLERQTRDLQEFVYIASHDLQSPLLSIEGFSERLLDKLGDDLEPGPRRWLERIRANVAHMGSLIRGILDLSRLNTRQNPVQTARASELAEQAAASLKDRFDEKGIVLELQGGEWPPVAGDLPRLQAVFTNLLDNASKYMGPDNPSPRVEVGYEQVEDELFFWVKDNGVGVPEEHREKVFRPLERLKAVDAHGVGMGLSLVRKVIESHGGSIAVEAAPGGGSIFRFSLPAGGEQVEG